MSRKEVFREPHKVFDVQISHLAKLVYLFLRYEAGTNYSVECSRDDIGLKCSVRRNAVSCAMSELRDVGLIFEKRQGLNKPNFICLDWGGDDED